MRAVLNPRENHPELLALNNKTIITKKYDLGRWKDYFVTLLNELSIVEQPMGDNIE